MSRPRLSRFLVRLPSVLLLGLVAVPSPIALSQTAPPSAEVIQRYEQILERAPMAGPSLDRLLQIYAQGEGLDQLDQRWATLAAEPGDRGATYSLLRGLLADNAGRGEDAVHYLTVATSSLPDDFHGWLALGDADAHQGRWGEAVAALQKGLATKVAGDDRLTVFHKLGQAQQSNLDVTGALATWRQMVTEFPTDRFAVEEAGNALLDAGQFDEARKTFQQLVNLAEPDSMNRVQALMHLAEVDNRQGKTDDAVHGYETILPLTAEGSWLNRELRAQIEQIFRRDNDLPGLVAYYQRWTLANPKDVDAVLRLAATLGELNRNAEALDALRKVTVLAPDRHEVRETFAAQLVEAGQLDEAITVGLALTADDPTEPRYWETLGEAYWRKTQPPTATSKQTALDAWQHVAPLDGKDLAGIVVLTDLLNQHHLTTEALAGYQRGLTLAPEAVDIREKEVKLLLEMKRTDEAWRVLDDLVTGDRNTPANDARLAALQMALGRADAAAATLQKGLALDPKNFDLLMAEWNRLNTAQDWDGVMALYDRLLAAAPDPATVEQLESRNLQTLTAAGKLDETAVRLQARLGAQPALTESELWLLTHILIQRVDPAASTALAEAARRFPSSISLGLLAADFASQQGKYDDAIAAWQRLVELSPQRKTDWLTAMVRVRQDQGNPTEALKLTEQIIAASPITTTGYLLYAEVALAAGQSDAAITRLQQAIKLVDQPNVIRLRLIRYYLDAGAPGKARTLSDDAFAAAEDQAERLSIVRLMATAYSQDGRLDELVNRFRQAQNGDEESARNGAYLSAIYEQTQDLASARRELAKSLAARPRDTSLLRSLIALAEKSGDQAELLRYGQMLVEIEPVVANQLALAAEDVRQELPAEAWRVIEANQVSVRSDPLAWKDLVLQIADSEYAAKARALLEAAISTQGHSSLAGRLALAQFQIVEGNLTGAQETLWALLATPIPLATVAPTPGGGKGAPTVAPSAFDALEARIQQAQQTTQEAEQLLNPGLGNNRNRSYSSPRSGVTSANAPANPTALKDRALIYLSLLAVQQQAVAPFLQTLQTRVVEWHWPLADRLAAYAIIQAREPLLQTIEEQAKATNPDRDLDQLSYTLGRQYLRGDDGDSAFNTRIEVTQTSLAARLANEADPRYLDLQLEEAFQSDDNSPSALAKRQATFAALLQRTNRHQPDDLIKVIQYGAQVEDWDAEKAAVADLRGVPGLSSNPNVRSQLFNLPRALLSRPQRAGQTLPADLPATLVQLLRLSIPATPPPIASSGTSAQIKRINLNSTAFPPVSRYFTANQTQQLQQLYQVLKSRKLLPAMEAALAADQQALGDWRQIYPTLIGIYFQWWDGKHDDAIATMRAQLTARPDDDTRQLLAYMDIQQKKYDEAVAVLETMATRSGQDYINAQILLLRTANLAKNQDEAKKAGLRLVAMKLSPQDANQILNELRTAGLTDEASKLQAARNTGAQSRSTQLANNQTADQKLLQALQQAVNGKNEAKALEIARQVLQRDPLATASSNGSSMNGELRSRALDTLRTFDALEGYASQMEAQAKADPGSVRANWLAGEALALLPDTAQETRGLRSGPHWLKVERAGQQFAAYASFNGTDWTGIGGPITLTLAPHLLVGLWVSTVPTAPAAEASFSEFAVRGSAPASPPSPPPTSIFQQADIGTTSIVGGFAPADAGGSIRVTGPIGGSVVGEGHFSYQSLDGDGTIVVRLNDLGDQPESADLGLMLRESADPDSLGLLVNVNRAHGLEVQSRRAVNNDWMAIRTVAEFNDPSWLKLARVGDQIHGAFSADGREWSEAFTRTMPWGAQALAGLIAGGDGSHETGEYTWADLGVKTGAASPSFGPTTPAPLATAAGALPPPWTYHEIGRATAAGHANWNGNEVAISVAPYTNQTGTDAASVIFDDFEEDEELLQLTRSTDNGGGAGFVSQPLAGDGEVMARLSAAHPGNSGLALRGGLEPTSPEIRLAYGPSGTLILTARTDTKAKAADYFRRVTVLSPTNLEAWRRVLALNLTTDRPDAALTAYSTLLKVDAPTALEMSLTLLAIFEHEGKLADFLRTLTQWNPPTLGLNGLNNGADLADVLPELGSNLERLKHPSEAEQLYRKALALPLPQNRDQLQMALIRVLEAQDKQGEANEAFTRWFAGEPAPTAVEAPLLGMGGSPRSGPGWNTLFLSWGYSNQEFMPSPSVLLLEQAAARGLAGQLQAILLARPAAPKSTSPDHLGEVRMAELVLRALAHDPAYRTELEQLLAAHPEEKIGTGNERVFYLVMIRELTRWPQERAMALQLLRQLFAEAAEGTDVNFRNLIGFQLIGLAGEQADHATVQATLRRMVTEVGANVSNSGLMPQLVHALVREGMFTEATTYLTEVRNDPQIAAQLGNSKTSVSIQLAQLQADLDFSKGDTAPAALAYGLDLGAATPSAPGAPVEFYWQMQSSPVAANGNGNNNSGLSWSEYIPDRATPDRIEIETGPDENHLQPLTTLTHAATQGHMPVVLPADTGVLRARLLPPDPPAGAPAATELATGPAIFVSTGANLLLNPSFQTTRMANGDAEVAGWHGAPASAMTIKAGGPLPADGYTTILGIRNNNGGQEISSDRIPLPPAGPNLLLSGWVTSGGIPQLRFLDAEGKTLNMIGIGMGSSSNSDDWHWISMQLLRNPAARRSNTTTPVPAMAAFVQINFESGQQFKVAGLSLRPLAAPPAASSPTAAAPTRAAEPGRNP